MGNIHYTGANPHYCFGDEALSACDVPKPPKRVRKHACGIENGCSKIPLGLVFLYKNTYCGKKDLVVLKGSKDLRTLQAESFRNCINLEVVSCIPNLEIIGDYAFAGCRSLRSIHLPACLKEVGAGAFSGCTELGTVYLPRSAKVSASAFTDCPNVSVIYF